LAQANGFGLPLYCSLVLLLDNGYVQPPLPARDDDKRRLDALLARRWTLATDEHPLGRLQGRTLGPYRLLVLLGPKNNVGARYLQLFLVDGEGRLSEEPIAFGLHNTGPYPGYNWAEVVRYQPAPRFDGAAADLRSEGLEQPLFDALSSLVPAGGHLMVEYDSPAQKASERALTLGYPPVTSPLGYLMFHAGCRGFRDWYISEGGREGPRKLQGFKPLNAALAAERTAALRREVAELLARPESPQHGEHGRRARELARAVLEALDALDAEQGAGNEEQGRAPPRVP
jgi:hypothetical protein